MDDAATLENFQLRASVAPLMAALTSLLHSAALGQSCTGLYVWGGEGVGKSHLLQAACHGLSMSAPNSSGALYLPLRELIDYPPAAVLEGCDHTCLVAIDELDAISERPDWQEALFHLFNRRRDAGLAQIYAGAGAPATYPDWLPDLRSRLGSLTVFQIPRFEEGELAALLQFRAGLRGLVLSDDVVQFILSRAPRATTSLMALLDTLDEEALARGRAVTVPLINELKVLFPDR